jgi:hypothetical protein
MVTLTRARMFIVYTQTKDDDDNDNEEEEDEVCFSLFAVVAVLLPPDAVWPAASGRATRSLTFHSISPFSLSSSSSSSSFLLFIFCFYFITRVIWPSP